MTRKLLLSIGFVALSVGVVAAWNTPAGAYEVSIYRATPAATWIGVAIAYATAVATCSVDPRDRISGLALVLGGAATVTIAGIPLIRSYRFYGAGDALTHHGWAQDMRTGALEPVDLLYPGGHAMSVLVGEVFALSTMRAMLLVVTILVAMFVMFIPFTVRSIVQSPTATAIAAFSGFLILPVNNVSTHPMFHAYSVAMLLFPLFLYLLVRHVMADKRQRHVPTGSTEMGLILVGIAILFLHPQVKLNLIILLAAFVGVYVMARMFLSGHPLARVRPVYGAFLVLTAAWGLWTPRQSQLWRATDSIISSVYATFLGEADVGETASETGASAGDIGVPMWELFMKLFFVPSIYVALSLAIVIVAIVSTIHRHPRRDHSMITYVGAAGVVLVPFFLLHFVGAVSGYFFRHAGFAMVIGTVLGSIALYEGGRSLSQWVSKPSLGTVAAVLLAVLLVVSLISLFPSPYMYLPGGHITDDEARGYQTAFAISDEHVEWSGIRTGPGRFFDALTPDTRPDVASGHSTGTDESLGHLLTGSADSDVYLPVTQRDVEREVVAYNELRYSAASLEAIGEDPYVQHVYTNGDFELYYVTSSSD